MYKITKDFIAIDVETATRKGGICQIGIVTVSDGIITDRECLYIQPPGNLYCDINIGIHGITPQKTADAPSLKESWPYIHEKLCNKTIIGHNISFDLNAINKDLEHYGLDPFEPENICTYKILNARLTDCCRHYGIDICNHHDALCDAEACARVYLAYLQSGEKYPLIEKSSSDSFMEHKKLSSDVKKKDLSNVCKTGTIFYDKIVVITGTFERFPVREALAQLLKEYGADINGSISKKTDIVIAGNGAGPKKLEKITSLQTDGYPILLLTEIELYRTLDCICSNTP